MEQLNNPMTTTNYAEVSADLVQCKLEFIDCEGTSKTKCGEIFRNLDGVLSFLCNHCLNDFESLSTFTEHIECHFGLIALGLKNEQGDEAVPPIPAPSSIPINSLIAKVESPHIFSQEATTSNGVTCKTCNESFACVGLRDHHNNIHRQRPKRHSCSLCTALFMNESLLAEHNTTVHTSGEDTYDCRKCSIAFCSQFELMMHSTVKEPTRSKCNKKASPQKYFECNVCKVLFNTRHDQRQHLKNLHGRQPHDCTLCDKSFRYQSLLEKHLLEHSSTTVTKYSCDLCQKEFSAKNYVRVHMHVKHLAKKPHECKTCSKSYAFFWQLEKHNQSHRNDGIKREADQTLFSILDKPKKEISPKKLPQSKIYECNVCMDKFRSRHEQRQHLARLHGKQPHDCILCGKSFRYQSLLEKHLVEHSSDTIPKYTCDLCQKEFSSKNYVRVHIHAHHMGEKPYQCEICSVSYAFSWQLIRHINRKHKQMDRKKHLCDICGRAFAWPHQLAEHNLMHSGIKPHQCDFCEKKFARKLKLRLHQIRMHSGGVRPFTCRYCEATFRYKETRATHEKNIHFHFLTLHK